LYRIADAVLTYELEIYVDKNLMAEIVRNARKITENTLIARKIEHDIRQFTYQVNTIPSFTNSPDPKDNFLFDLALQTNSEVIVTKERALLNFTESPIPIHDIKWFKETYPVEL
jgi:predicted nucleic acid-binding protein